MEQADGKPDRYKIGDAFFHIKLEQAKELLEKAMSQVDDDVSGLEEKLSSLKDQMTQLKVELYARFGKSINLEK
jgi:prefoldin subunit 4